MADIDAEVEDLGRNTRFGSDTRGRRARTARQPGDSKMKSGLLRGQSIRRTVPHNREHVGWVDRARSGSRAEDAAIRAIVIHRRARRRAIGFRCANRARDTCELMSDDHASDAEAREQRLQRERVGRD
jgi:hypothetical protein